MLMRMMPPLMAKMVSLLEKLVFRNVIIRNILKKYSYFLNLRFDFHRRLVIIFTFYVINSRSIIET